MFEVLVFVYENYWRGDACPEPHALGPRGCQRERKRGAQRERHRQQQQADKRRLAGDDRTEGRCWIGHVRGNSQGQPRGGVPRRATCRD